MTQLQTISMRTAARMDARLKAMSMHKLTIALVGSLLFVAVLGVSGQFVADINYDLDSGSASNAGNNYDLISPELASNLAAIELARSSRYQSREQRPTYQLSPAEAQEDGLVNSLVASLLESREPPLQLQEQRNIQQVDLDSMAGLAGDLTKRQPDKLVVGGTDNDRDELYYYYDANAHLPASSPYGGDDDQLSGPANDPEEFEAKLGQLTDALNHKMSNTRAREQLLMSLWNSTSPLSSTLESSAQQQPVADLQLQLMVDNQALAELQRDNLVHELSEHLRQKLSTVNDNDNVYSLFGSTSDLDDSDGSGLNDDPESTSLSPSMASSAPSVSRYGGSEYIDHPLALEGHQYVQGGAGEGRQLLGPDGTFENVQVIKTDMAIPSYCDPPNPCPIGYTARDGCLEKFVNSASFSREYQAKQSCSCDNEHSLFQCSSQSSSGVSQAGSSAASSKPGGHNGDGQASSTPLSASDGDDDDDGGDGRSGGGLLAAPGLVVDKLSTLARAVQNRFGDLASVRKLMGEQQQENASGGGGGGAPHDEDNYLVRSARKWSPEMSLHKMQLD